MKRYSIFEKHRKDIPFTKIRIVDGSGPLRAKLNGFLSLRKRL